MKADVERFETRGYLGPIPILSSAECRDVIRALDLEPESAAPEWLKGHAASSRLFYELGTHAAILDPVAGLIGPDVMLWGASVVVRHPGQVHAWHTDSETARSTGSAVSVWLGLEGTNRLSSLQIVTPSHRFGITVQQIAAEKEKGRESPDTILAWARERDPASKLVELEARDGDAVFFDGRLWHGSANTRRETVRTALLLQYASPDTPIRYPRSLTWPFDYREDSRPPCVLVRGSGRHTVNRLVPAPPEKETQAPC